jgi:hypothetical protein
VIRYVKELFENGTLVRPSDQQPNLVHLVRAVATRAGVRDLDYSTATQQLLAFIPPSEHVVFVLVDGLGMNLVRKLPSGTFIRQNLVRPILATCPSTTACALTTVTTAQYPNRHAVTGWFTHLPDLGYTIATLPFADRMTHEPLSARGLRVEDVLPCPSICPRMTHHPLTIVPALIASTVYNVYSRGGTPGQGYHSIAHAIDRAVAHVTESPEPTYTHVYLPEVDTACHKRGVDSPDVLPLVLHIDAELTRLKQALGERALVVVCADHGLIDVPHRDQTLLLLGDPLLEMLVAPPSGDARMPIFHVKPGRRNDFVGMFGDRFSEDMLLLDIEQVQELALFGPGEFSPTARARFGDFVGIAKRPATIAFHPPAKPLSELYLAVHAGLSPAEMEVPLAVA